MLEILKYILPSLVVLLTACVVMMGQMRGETARQMAALKREQAKSITPVRLRGYERLALLLDRTVPETMLLNMNLPEMNCLQLQTALLTQIRQEYDHNAAQQIYVSNELWNLIRASKESLLHLVNTCAKNFKQEDSAFKFAETLIKTYNYTPDTPTELAMKRLKQEVRELF